MSATGRGNFRGGDRGGSQRGGGDRGGRGVGDRGSGDRGGRGGYGDDRGGRGGRGGDDRGGRGGGRGGDDRGRGGFGGRPDRNAPLEGIASIKATQLAKVTSDFLLPHNFGGKRVKLAADQLQAARAKTVEEYEAQRNKEQQAREKVMSAIKSVPKLQQGSTGTTSTVTTNFFPVAITHTTTVYQYDVVLSPDVPAPKLRKVIVEELLRGAITIPTNLSGGKILFAARELHEKGTKERVITHRPAAGAKGWKAREINLTLRFARTLQNPENGLTSELYQVYNSVISNALSAGGFVKIGGKYYDFDGKYTPAKDIGLEERDDPHHSLRLAGGLSMVMHPTQRGLLMAIDLAFRVSRKDTMLHFIESTRKLYPKDAQKQIDEGLTDVVGLCTYMTGQRKNTFKVTRVRHDLTPESPIPGHPDKLTFAVYLKNNYNLTVKNNQPMLEFESPKEKDASGAPRKLYYVPELTVFAGQSLAMRSNSYLQQTLKRSLIMVPSERFTNLMTLVNKTFTAREVTALLAPWGISITPKCVEVAGRVLADPTLSAARPITLNRHSWLLKAGTIVAQMSAAPKKWAVLHPQNADPRPFITALVDEQINQLTTNKWPQPQLIIPYRTGPGRVTMQNLENALDELEEDVQFFLACIPGSDDDHYTLVKARALQEWNIPNQCVLLRNFTPNVNRPDQMLNVASRVAGQVLTKCGSTLWQTNVNTAPHTVVVGIDVARSTKGARGSSVALVAATAKDGVTFCTLQAAATGSHGQVVTKLFGDMLKAYQDRFKSPVANVVVYRPGAHEGDILEFVEHEVLPMKQKLGKDQKLSYVISLKNSAVRLHPAPAGVVLDSDVVSPFGFSFYMVPQVVNMGTATAMKFSLLCNEVFETGAQLEELTWALCHMFYGWWGTTREPSVVMYATRAADLHSRLDPKKPLQTKFPLVAF